METSWVLLGLACFCDWNNVYRTAPYRTIPRRKKATIQQVVYANQILSPKNMTYIRSGMSNGYYPEELFTSWTSFGDQLSTLHADISLMVVRKVCTPCSKSFAVKRPSVSKYTTSLIDSVSIPQKPYATNWVIKAVDVGTALSTLAVSSAPLFGCQNLSSNFVAVYILIKQQLNL